MCKFFHRSRKTEYAAAGEDSCMILNVLFDDLFNR